ncbi:hypothetical protein TSTA_103290 [Talaromyces stipitatus ATCC 10500]|uniref:Uncharacterized protein n=1 Tax=Talaromyces stipitatus (strain ATCC 10500 / CBS 375.48 / QM 6759 / NRRL 1006) TaxID=441959 RepID=B8MNL6_TALSN|nr:uncharacterized protein TSTA_103290 [Talaromyces stipitatus ATCC 10500]EED14105.1 hypothetical protein TSTA_103290 [Talaromyces stipitatus ATCC 10500]
MAVPTSTDPSPDEGENNGHGQQSRTSPSELPAHHDQDPRPSELPSHTVSNVESEALPNYSRRPDSNAPRLPSYARVERTDRLRRESWQTFIESKMYGPDTFGGHKGITDGPPNDPLKPFRWIRRKVKGEKNVWRKLSVEERRKWEEEGGPVNYDAGECLLYLTRGLASLIKLAAAGD